MLLKKQKELTLFDTLFYMYPRTFFLKSIWLIDYYAFTLEKSGDHSHGVYLSINEK